MAHDVRTELHRSTVSFSQLSYPMGMMECMKNGISGIKANDTAVFVIVGPIQEFIQMDQTQIPLFHDSAAKGQISDFFLIRIFVFV